LIFLAASNPRGPPASVVLTDWLSITPAVGLSSRPSASRAIMTRWWLIFFQVAPPVEVPLHRRVGRKLLRQQPPLATALSDEKDRIHQCPHLRHTRPAAPVLAGHVGGDHRPLFVGRIACITQPISTIFRSGDFSPNRRSSQLRLNYKRLKSLNLISGQPLSLIGISGVRAPSAHCSRIRAQGPV
jgi:hypothetical protein